MTELEGFVPSLSAEFPNDNPALHEGVSWVCLAVGGPLRPVARPRPAGARPEALLAPPAEASPERASMNGDFAASAHVPSVLDEVPPEPSTAETPSLEALTLALDATETSPFVDRPPTASGDPLELDAIDLCLTLGAEDAVFDFDTDEAPSVSPAPAAVDTDEALSVSPAPAAVAVAARAARAEDAAAGTEACSDPFSAYVAAVIGVAEAAGQDRAAAILSMLLEGAEFDACIVPDEARARLVAAGILTLSGTALSPSKTFATTASAWRAVLRGVASDLSACGESTLDIFSADLLKAFGIGQGNANDVRRELRRRGVAAFGMLSAA